MTTLQRPTATTVRRLFALSMNRCAFPGCSTAIVDPATHTITAEICHIRAQRPRGPRYDSSQSSIQRHSHENLILMCSRHHKIIDAKKGAAYSPEKLLAIKSEHEAKAGDNQVPALSNALVADLLASIKPNKQSVHMDFRGATLKAGGEGGRHGGGGGDGGVFNIVGVTPAGFHEPIDLDGEAGRDPGSGGGGGGSAGFVGRAGDESDFDNGLRISTIFLANAISAQGNHLFCVLGGGWAWYDIPLPHPKLQLSVQCVIETGAIAQNTILRIDYSITRPDDTVAGISYFDLTLNPHLGKVSRYPAAFFPQFDADVPGVWKLSLSTGGIMIVEHEFEIRSTT